MSTLLFDRDGFGIRFRYPEALMLTENVTFERSAGRDAGVRHVALALDNRNLVAVSRRELRVDTRAVDWDALRAETDAVVARLASTVPPGAPVSLDGLRGLDYRFDLDGDHELHQWYTVLFDHALQYTINCQSTPARRAEIDAAGDLVRRTVEHRPG